VVETQHPARSALPIAVLIPCYNEEAAIAAVVTAFRLALPAATVFVYDNNSHDRTVAAARAAGAVVRQEPQQGKGNVIRRMFADIEADVYVLVDGDGTYDAAAAPEMVRRVLADRVDMVTAARHGDSSDAYRRGHRFGNRLLTGLVRAMFGRGVSDMLSGYRAFSRRFVKSFPAMAAGFEAETELTVHALQMRMPIAEVVTRYTHRAAGTVSKLNTYRDGWRILRTILLLLQQERPLQVFGLAGGLMLLTGLALGLPVVLEFVHTGLVPRLPTAVLATGLVLLATLLAMTGLILEAVTVGRKERKRLAYLSLPAPDAAAWRDVAEDTAGRFVSGNLS